MLRPVSDDHLENCVYVSYAPGLHCLAAAALIPIGEDKISLTYAGDGSCCNTRPR